MRHAWLRDVPELQAHAAGAGDGAGHGLAGLAHQSLLRRYSRRIQDSMGDVTRVAKESFEAPRLIKIYNAEAHLGRQFGAVNEHNRRSNMRLILTKGVSNPIIQTINSIGLAFVLALAISDVMHGRMTIGDLFAFIVALAQVSQPLQQFIGVTGQVQQGIAAADNLFDLLDEPSEPQTGGMIAGRCARRCPVRRRFVFVRARQGRRAERPDAGCSGGTTDRDRRTLRQRQVDAGQPAAALSRCGPGRGAHRRSRCARVHPAQPARADRGG